MAKRERRKRPAYWYANKMAAEQTRPLREWVEKRQAEREAKPLRKLVIAVDYDGTYTEDPALWDAFIRNAKRRGHDIFFVTGRFPHEKIADNSAGIPVHYTSLRCKADYMRDAGIDVDIVIEDSPEYWTADIPPPRGMRLDGQGWQV